jgi:hypothetical protein
MRSRIIQMLLALLVTCGRPALAETTYSKTVDLPPLRISFSELQNLLDKGTALISEANKSKPQWREEIQLRKGELRIKISGHQLNPEGAKIPEVIDTFDYNAYTLVQAPITRMVLTFNDYTRSMLIEGQSPEQVDALHAVLKDDLFKLSTSLGGRGLKAFLGFPLIYILGLAFIWLSVTWIGRRRPILLLPISISFLFLVMLLLLPIDDLFAGFSAVRGDASFLVRYGAVLSLIVSLVAIPISLVPMLFSNGRQTEQVVADKALKGTGQNTEVRS